MRGSRSFIRPPAVVVDYLRGRVAHGAGHSPLGALSVLAMLARHAAAGIHRSVLATTAISPKGRSRSLVSGALGERVSTVHRWGEWAIYALVGLHLAAVAYYSAFRSLGLVRPMITGDRAGLDAPPGEDGVALRLRALVLAALAAGLVAWIVNL